MKHHISTCKRTIIPQATSSITSVFLSIVASSHHWLHMAILFFIGGSTTNMMTQMSSLLWIRRLMIIVTILMLLFTIYRLYKHRHMPKWMVLLSIISVIISVGFIGYTINTFGW